MIEELKKQAIVIDIETSSLYHNGQPIDISINFEDYIKFAKVKWVGMYSYKFNKLISIQVVGNEDKIKNFINEHKIIVGFNNEEFDTPILRNNGLISDKWNNQVDCLVVLGSSTFYRHDGLSFKNRGSLMGYKFKKNSLKCMAETMELEVQKGDIDYNIFHKNVYTDEEKEEIIKYLDADVMATKGMFDKLWDFWLPFTNFLDEKNINNLCWIKSSIASLTYRAACNVLGVEDTYSEDNRETKKEEMGGRVILPKFEEARQVWYVDFTSLYPHIFTMFNLFNEVPETKLDNSNVKLWTGNDMFKVKGVYDISRQHPLSKDVAEKLKERVRLKKEDPNNPLVYAYKIFLNSLYGAARSPIFEQIHTPNCGWDCCWLGQQINEYTEKRLIEFGFNTIAGDTDSVFIKHLGDVDDEYVKKCLDIVVNEIKDNVPFPCDTFNIDLEYPNALPYIMWAFEEQPIKGEDGKNIKNEKGRLIKEYRGKKKNYAYIFKDKEGNNKVKIMGLPIIKDNATALGQKILQNFIVPKMKETTCGKFDKKLIESTLNDYLKKPESLELLSREYKIKPANNYKLESQVQAQISNGYFNGQDGVIRLIKTNITGDENKKGYRKVGCAGKGQQYVTVQEALENNLNIKDFDLKKIINELKPFIKREVKN